MTTPTGHRWSGWPGAHCLDCGAAHAHEMAVARGWWDALENADRPEWMGIPTFPPQGKWKSDKHRRFVELCDYYCLAKVPPDEGLPIARECYALAGEIGEANPCPNCRKLDLEFSVVDGKIRLACPCGWSQVPCAAKEKP